MGNLSKRILILNTSLRPGGVERKIADLALYFTQHPRANVRIELLVEQGAPPADERMFWNIVTQSVISIRVKPATPFVPLLLYLLWYVIRQQPDTVLAYSRRPSVYALAVREILCRHKLRVLVGNDTVASRALAEYVPQPFVRRILAAQMRRLYPNATLLLAPSETSKRDLIENFRVPSEKICVLKNWTPIVTTTDEPKRFDLIYVGRVERLKQIERLIEIAGCVETHFPELRTVIVGDGGELENVKQYARMQYPQTYIEFVGFQSDIGTFLAQAKIFCLTSEFEGLPIAALEAMAYGLPVVTLAYAGAEELVHSGDTGFVCDNVNEFCNRITELLTDDALRVRLGQQAQAFVRREHGANILDAYAATILNAAQPTVLYE